MFRSSLHHKGPVQSASLHLWPRFMCQSHTPLSGEQDPEISKLLQYDYFINLILLLIPHLLLWCDPLCLVLQLGTFSGVLHKCFCPALQLLKYKLMYACLCRQHDQSGRRLPGSDPRVQTR